MSRQWLAVGVCLTCALAIGAVQQVPPPSPDATPSFRSGISYVELGASVLDKARNPVTGLSAADFTVLEDGQPQKILSFSEINIPDPPPPPVAWMRDVTPDVQANDEAMNGRLVVILLDDAHARNDQANLKRTKDVANLLIDRLGPADRATVLFTRLLGSQDFTSDHAKLRAAVNRFVPFRSPFGCDECLRYSLDRLEKIATDLAALPGRRKALFYFGEGVPMPDLDGKNDPFMLGVQLERIFREAQRANLNIYPIDPSGLTGLGEFDAGKSLSGLPPSEFYRTVAENTGGLATVNRNDLDSIVAPALRENGAYYLLGYQSPNLKTDGVFRKIDVKVNRPGVTVRARSGYYGVKVEATKKAVAAANVSSRSWMPPSARWCRVPRSRCRWPPPHLRCPGRRARQWRSHWACARSLSRI
jgi:VWFA-related protein